MVQACDEALHIVDELELPDKPSADIQPQVGTGYGCTEAPRGLLYHRYRMDDRGVILDAKIVPPTSQNLKTIESDLKEFVAANIELEKNKLQWKCEQLVRNYDPCISCSTHFLTLDVDHECPPTNQS
jgi:coenzyme F420-reducing hydrogenase alpha subunit